MFYICDSGRIQHILITYHVIGSTSILIHSLGLVEARKAVLIPVAAADKAVLVLFFKRLIICSYWSLVNGYSSPLHILFSIGQTRIILNLFTFVTMLTLPNIVITTILFKTITYYIVYCSCLWACPATSWVNNWTASLISPIPAPCCETGGSSSRTSGAVGVSG